MNLPFFIARRYFLSRRKKSFINILSVISMAVVGLSTMALVIVLSVFNGLEGLLRNLYGSFDAQVTVLPSEGKSFFLTPELLHQVRQVPGVVSVVDIIEDNALIKYKNSQRVVRLKGVGDGFIAQGRFDDAILLGDLVLKEDSVGYAIVGRGIQNDLSLTLMDEFYPMVIHYPRDIRPGQLNPERMFSQEPVVARSAFAVEKSFDDNYVFVPVEITRQLLGYGDRRTALELEVQPGQSLEEVKLTLMQTLGPGYTVKLNEELRGSLYRILKLEKIFVFLTFGIIIAIGSVNIYFSLSMLVIDKKRDLTLLKALGAPGHLVGRIIFAEGVIIALAGALTGLLLGLAIAGLQEHFGLVSMGVQGAISEAYPVKIIWTDVLLTALLVALITVVSSLQPTRKAAAAFDFADLQ